MRTVIYTEPATTLTFAAIKDRYSYSIKLDNSGRQVDICKITSNFSAPRAPKTVLGIGAGVELFLDAKEHNVFFGGICKEVADNFRSGRVSKEALLARHQEDNRGHLDKEKESAVNADQLDRVQESCMSALHRGIEDIGSGKVAASGFLKGIIDKLHNDHGNIVRKTSKSSLFTQQEFTRGRDEYSDIVHRMFGSVMGYGMLEPVSVLARNIGKVRGVEAEDKFLGKLKGDKSIGHKLQSVSIGSSYHTRIVRNVNDSNC